MNVISGRSTELLTPIIWNSNKAKYEIEIKHDSYKPLHLEFYINGTSTSSRPIEPFSLIPSPQIQRTNLPSERGMLEKYEMSF